MAMAYEHRARFRDRTDAGTQLAERLKAYQSLDTIVLAVPGGGVPVAVEVARSLNAPLDVVVTRKITIPGNPEAGYGAVAEDGAVFLNEPLVTRLGLSRRQIEFQAAQVLGEIERRSALYRRNLPRASLEGKTTIIVDRAMYLTQPSTTGCASPPGNGRERAGSARPARPAGRTVCPAMQTCGG
jgi:predicted phosphoribosyltransferase